MQRSHLTLYESVGPFDKDPDDDIPFRGFEEDTEE
jgi:hypothetical protein